MPVIGRPVSGNFDSYLQDFITDGEDNVPAVYHDSVGVPTVGIGYALLTRNAAGKYVVPKAHLQSDFNGIYTFTTADFRLLNTIATDLNTNNVVKAESDLDNRNSSTLPIDLSDPQATQIFIAALDRNVNAGIPSDIQTQLAGTHELAALEDLAYNGPGLIGSNLVAALRESDPIQARLDAWNLILFHRNGGKSSSTGVEERRFKEANEFGLYSQGNMPSQTDGGKEAIQVANFLNTDYSSMLTYLEKFYSSSISISEINSFYQPAETTLLSLDIYVAHPDGTLTTPDPQDIAFSSKDFELVNVGLYGGTISNFSQGDTLDLTGIGIANKATLSAGNVLTVQGGGGGNVKVQLNPEESYTGDSFTVASDNNGGTDVTITSVTPTPTPIPTPIIPPITPPSSITVSPPAGILVPPPTKALTYTYWNVGDGNWNNPANWTNGVPTATIEAIVTSSTAITITIDGVSVADYLELYHASSVTFQITTGTLGLETSSTIGNLMQSGGLVYLVSGTSSISAINQTGGTIYIASGELDADDGGSIDGTVSGSGTFVTKEGDFTLGRSAVISTPTWTVGTNSTLTLASNFAYAKDFTLSGDSIIYLNGYTLSLDGTGELGGAFEAATTGNPAGTVLVEGTLDVNGLRLSGAVTLEDAKLVTQSGALTFSNGATAMIDEDATWNITANVIDYAGEAAPKGSIVNTGLFEKTGGTGTADISVATINTGSISVTSSELEFLGGLNSTGTMTASGAILYVNNGLSGSGNIDIINKGTAEFRTPVASTFNAVFEDATGTLQLDTPASFAGKIAGLQSGDFIDVTTGLTSDSYANGILTVSQTGFGVRGQLNIAGSFTTSSFHLSSDGHGGTNITV